MSLQLAALPNDVISRILGLLPPDLVWVATGAVSRTWHVTSEKEDIWRSLARVWSLASRLPSRSRARSTRASDNLKQCLGNAYHTKQRVDASERDRFVHSLRDTLKKSDNLKAVRKLVKRFPAIHADVDHQCAFLAYRGGVHVAALWGRLRSLTYLPTDPNPNPNPNPEVSHVSDY